MGFGDIASGIGGIFASSGLSQNAKSLDAAAGLEDVNARIAEASMSIQHTAAQRDIYKVSGAQSSEIAASGFKSQGTAQDLARDTASQGAITHALIQAQGEIEIQGHEVQAANLRAQAQAARSAAKSSMIGGILSIASGIFGLFSDERLKENLVRVGERNGLPVYRYTYRDDPTKTEYVGFMAQDVEQVDPSAVIDMGMKFITSKYAPEKVDA